LADWLRRNTSVRAGKQEATLETVLKRNKSHSSCAAKSPRHGKSISTLLFRTRGAAMTAIARALLNTIPAISSDIDNLETVALFSGAGLLISLCLALSVLYGNFGAF
jgi:hypothetical protein